MSFIFSFLAASVCMVYTTITPIYPIQASNKHIPQEYVGQIIGIYSLASVVTSPFLAVLMRKFRKQSLIMVGLLLMSFSLFIMSSLHFIENRTMFIALSFLCRIGQGVSETIVIVCILALVQITSSKDKYQRNIFILETSKSIGFSAGPLIASFAQQIVGFSGVFIILGSFLGLCAVLSKLTLGKVQSNVVEQMSEGINHRRRYSDAETNVGTSGEEDAENAQINRSYLESLLPQEEQEMRPFLSFKILLLTRNVFLALVQVFMIITTFSYWEPQLALHLIKLGVDQGEIGYYFALNTIVMVFAGFSAVLIPQRFHPRSILLSFNVFQAISLLFIGPSEIFGNGNAMVLTAIGLAFSGGLFPFSFSTIIPTIQRTISDEYPNYSSEGVSEKIAVLFMIARGSSITLSPVISSFLSGIGFKLGRISQIFALCLASFTMIYFIASGDLKKLFNCRRQLSDGKGILYEEVIQQISIVVQDTKYHSSV